MHRGKRSPTARPHVSRSNTTWAHMRDSEENVSTRNPDRESSSSGKTRNQTVTSKKVTKTQITGPHSVSHADGSWQLRAALTQDMKQCRGSLTLCKLPFARVQVAQSGPYTAKTACVLHKRHPS